MRVLSTGRFSLLVVKGVMVKEPQDWVLRLTLLSVGEQGLLAAAHTERRSHSQSVMVLFRSNLSYTFLAHAMMGRHHFFLM